MKNTGDLLVSPEHRLFVLDESNTSVQKTTKLVRAKDLIDGQNVLRKEGGYVDYLQLLFDQHQIIYAEGIPAESLLIDPRTRSKLPNVRDKRDNSKNGKSAYEVQENILPQDQILRMLRIT